MDNSDYLVVLKKLRYNESVICFWVGFVVFASTTYLNISFWYPFIGLMLIIVVYNIFVRPLVIKVANELFVSMTIRDITMDRIGRDDEEVSRALLSRMSEGTKPWMEWISKLHPDDCRVLATVAKKNDK